MTHLDHFDIHDGYARFHPVGRVTWRALLVLLEQAMAACTERGVTKLLVSTSTLTHAPLTLADRYFLGEGLAKLWDRSIRLSVVSRPDQIDPDRFGLVVARNRGLIFGLFVSETEALEWLLEPEAY